MKRPNIGEKLSLLAKMVGISQASLADKIGVPASTINRFFRGRNDLNSTDFLIIMKEFGLNVEEMISKRLQSVSDIAQPNSMNEVVLFLFNELDDLGKQSFLKTLLWAARTSRGNAFPKHIEEVAAKEISLI